MAKFNVKAQTAKKVESQNKQIANIWDILKSFQ
jgi:hypothetical protein